MNASSRIYLDYNASAPLCVESMAAMEEWLSGTAANASAAHRNGQRARAAIERARTQVAALLGCDPAAVVFTSGGTEADNTALLGVLGWPPKGHVLISEIEHPAVIEPAAALAALGLQITRLAVDQDARVDPRAVRDAIRADTALISIMTANNEVGTLQPVEEIGEIAREAGVLFHTDAVQAAPWLDIHPITAAADMVSISSHKLAGPLGVGALYVRPGLEIVPLMRGGGQQGGRRGGTEATASIVGFGAACERARRRHQSAAERVALLRDRLERNLGAAVPESRSNGSVAARLPNTCHVSFARCDGNALVARLDLDGVAASAGAACASGVAHASAVVDALGVPPEYRAGSLRLSLGYETVEADIERTLGILPDAVASLRRAGLGALG